MIGTPSLERFTIEGSGDVKIQGLSSDKVKLVIEGSGTITALGSVRDLTGSIEGSGNLDLAELDAEEADLTIEGSGSMAVLAEKTLHYSIEGSGDIRYSGEPKLDGDIEGSGDREETLSDTSSNRPSLTAQGKCAPASERGHAVAELRERMTARRGRARARKRGPFQERFEELVLGREQLSSDDVRHRTR